MSLQKQQLVLIVDVESRDCLYVQQCRTVARTQQCSQLSQRQCSTVYDIK